MPRPCSILLLLSLLAMVPAPGVAGAVVQYQLIPDVTATLGPDGDLQVAMVGAVSRPPRLVTRWDWPAGGRPQDPGPVFTGVAREGDPGGRRGFSPSADDDGDGPVDEDPCNGRDDDGDGRIDEDHAAVSHRMGIWHQRRGATDRQVQTYHWAWPHLQSVVVLHARQTGTAALERLRLVLTDHTPWQELDRVCLGADVPPTGPLFLAGPAAGAGPAVWLGVAILADDPSRRPDARVRTEDHRLLVPLAAGEVAVAVSTGRTRLQVIDDLAAAARLHRGMTDPVTGRRVPWLPQAVPPNVPDDRRPRARLASPEAGRWELRVPVSAAAVRRFDPDLFRLGERALGAPNALAWEPAAAAARTLDWPDAPGAACDPYAVLAAQGEGVVTYRFAGPPPEARAVLHARLADGRAVDLPLSAEPPEARPAAPASTRQLAPRLLSTYPNPFRITTRIRFEVPATAGEAFVWEGEGPPPFSPHERLPFADGSASVAVRIYSVEGKEVASLFSGQAGVGTYEASWDGRDALGRTVASGAYICKLQIENYRVTKQLIFVR
jgi:hypothetical protein